MTSTCSFSPQLSVLGFQSSAFSLITLPLKKDRIFSADQSAYVAGRRQNGSRRLDERATRVTARQGRSV
ncbi:MAG: hypothetical protein DMF89_11625 [Acidobacteria bacterium]|nr:MAG: hypothetical protein DMF89_11625 [Acidobacteriota bacterium]